MQVLFLNEGNLGSYIMGQAQLEQALHIGLPYAPEVQARFAGVGPLGRVTHSAATRPIGALASTGLDFRTLRWHLVQALRARRAVRKELRAWPADVVHVHSHSIALTMAGVMRTVPMALSVDTTVRDWWSMPAQRDMQRNHREITIAPSVALERRACEHAAVVLAWTAWVRRAVESSAPSARVVEHHPGIDLDRYHPAPRRPRACPRVLFVGGRFVAKGGQDLLDALGDQLGDSVEVDLVTPEDVPERPGVRIHRLGPSDPQLLDLQQQADLFCLPSKADAVPWAVLEAMACGTPVLSTRVGGIGDLLEDGSAGVLVPADDPRALRDGLRSLLDDNRKRESLAARARERCERRFDARLQLPAMVEHFREVLEDDRAQAGTQAGRPRRSST